MSELADSRPRTAIDSVTRPAFGVRVPSIASRVAQELRFQIAEGHLLPGTQLKEESLSSGFHVSRNTVREAFAELAAERLIVREPNRGVFVSILGADDLKDVFAVRRVVELGAIRSGGSPVSIASVRAAVLEGQDAVTRGDAEAVGNANQHFHFALVAMADSPRLDEIMAQLLAEMRLFFHKAVGVENFYADYLLDNDQICSALESGYFQRAETLLSEYLLRSEVQLTNIHRR
jgi:DNA-binding GntR family transcriptional regulator